MRTMTFCHKVLGHGMAALLHRHAHSSLLMEGTVVTRPDINA